MLLLSVPDCVGCPDCGCWALTVLVGVLLPELAEAWVPQAASESDSMIATIASKIVLCWREWVIRLIYISPCLFVIGFPYIHVFYLAELKNISRAGQCLVSVLGRSTMYNETDNYGWGIE